MNVHGVPDGWGGARLKLFLRSYGSFLVGGLYEFR